MSVELNDVLILNNSGKRYRLAFYLPGQRSVEMQPVGEISADEAKEICEKFAKAVRAPEPNQARSEALSAALTDIAKAAKLAAALCDIEDIDPWKMIEERARVALEAKP